MQNYTVMYVILTTKNIFCALGIVLQTAVNVDERPITQQGLTGLRTGTAKGPGRRFEDKSFFMGELRRKMNELQTEIARINREIEADSQEQSTFIEYDKRVKEVAAELTGQLQHRHLLRATKIIKTMILPESQGVLADYNLLVDKLNTDTDRAEVESDANDLRDQNDAEAREVESLFSDKQSRY